jgi:uncharacterized membrane protein YjfL (UPF0719 family)
VTAYCFGDISQEQRDRFEAHLLECDFCWSEVQRLDETVQSLRGNKTLTREVYVADIVAATGISAQIDKVVGGHWIHALVASGLCAFLFAEAVLLEVAYSYDQFAAFVWIASPIVFVATFATTMLALFANWHLVRRRNSAGALAAMGVLVGAAAALFIALRTFLPGHSITQATFQTYSAQAAYLKGLFYLVPFAIIFLVVPFNFILVMQRELASGRHQAGLELLTGGRMAVAPRGAPYPRLSVLCGLLILGATASVISTAHLLESLKPTTFSNLFVQVIQIRWLAFLALGVECLVWYHWALSELKRECLIVARMGGVAHR